MNTSVAGPGRRRPVGRAHHRPGRRALRLIARAAAVGTAATAVMDLGGEIVHRTTGVAPLDYRLLGRWIGHLRYGRMAHQNIAAAEPVAGEKALGWTVHYSIGTGFAGALLLVRPAWAARPTLGPALAAGLATTAAPWLLLQPAFGLGVAASRTPHPQLVRWRTLRTHAMFGAGLYTGGRLMARLAPVR